MCYICRQSLRLLFPDRLAYLYPSLSPQLKQKLYQSQQRATLCSRAAEEAEESRGEAEKSRALAEARALGCQQDKEVAEADRGRMSGELQQLRKEVRTHTQSADLQSSVNNLLATER